MTTWIAEEQNRLDKELAQNLPLYSRSKLQKFIEGGLVSVNDKQIVESRYGIIKGDVINFINPSVDPQFPDAEEQPLEIIYEDDAILAINKPVNMVVHPNDFHAHGTLVQAVLAIRPAITQALYDPESSVSRLRPGVVHRLDKDTSGVIVLAKTSDALHNLSLQFQNHTTKKEYKTVLYGELTTPQTVTAPIQRRGGGDKNRMGASHNPEEGREAISHFQPIVSCAPYPAWPTEKTTFAKVIIETGRTHQIRVHAKFIGHPVMGDELYGNKPSLRLSAKLGVHHQLLHAAKLTLRHPITNIEITLTAPLPNSFEPFSHDIQTGAVQ